MCNKNSLAINGEVHYIDATWCNLYVYRLNSYTSIPVSFLFLTYAFYVQPGVVSGTVATMMNTIACGMRQLARFDRAT